MSDERMSKYPALEKMLYAKNGPNSVVVKEPACDHWGPAGQNYFVLHQNLLQY